MRRLLEGGAYFNVELISMWLSLEEIRQVYSVHLGSCIPHLILLLKSNRKKAKQQLYVN